MKRSEINKALKELENMIKEYRYFLPKFADFTRRNGRARDTNTMKSVTICLVGTLRILVWEILIKSDFLSLLFVTETLK